jgi:hypothetical protein
MTNSSVTDTAPAPEQGRAVAASYLRQLLVKPGSYRRQWEQHVVRARHGDINQLAVAEVLARHLWNYPRRPGDAEVLPRQLKDSVSRALSGRLLSRPLLSLFIDAFGIAGSEAERLWRMYEGSSSVTVLHGSRAMSPKAESDLRAALGPRRHQTLALHDHAEIGADRLLVRTRTMQVIEAVAPGTGQIPYLYDTSALTLEVGPGCRGISRELFQVGDVFATQILLTRELAAGETTTLEYWTTYQYAEPLTPQHCQYRRGVMASVENVDIRVQFHPDALPATVWWATWDGVDGEVTSQEEARLDVQLAAHRYLRAMERTVVGFHWDW